MEWKQAGKRSWIAGGNKGQFVIEQCGGVFWARYAATAMLVKFSPKKKLKDAKAQCEHSEYWETINQNQRRNTK